MKSVREKYLRRIDNESRKHKMTLNSNISFSSAPPTTYIMTSPSILNTTTRLSYSITSALLLFVFSIRPFSSAFWEETEG